MEHVTLSFSVTVQPPEPFDREQNSLVTLNGSVQSGRMTLFTVTCRPYFTATLLLTHTAQNTGQWPFFAVEWTVLCFHQLQKFKKESPGLVD